jgi:hypothetical protein
VRCAHISSQAQPVGAAYGGLQNGVLLHHGCRSEVGGD